MMKKICIGDAGEVSNSTNKSFEELEEDVARHASDASEARKRVKERIMHRFVSRILDDAKNDQRVMRNMKNQETRVIKTTDDARRLHDENNNEEKGVVQVQVKKPNLIKRGEKEEEEEEDDHESLKKQGESSYFCVPPKKRIRFNQKAKLDANNRKNKRKKFINNGNKRFADVGIDPPPALPDKLKKYIEENGGSDIKLVIMKKIFEADLIRRNNRISIPKNQIRDDSVLTEEEKEFIKHENEKSESERESYWDCDCDNNNTKKKKKTDLVYPGLVVKLIEPSMEESEQYLKTYDTNSLTYVVTDGWNSVVERNKDVLQIGRVVQLWSFRRRPLTPEEESNRFFVHKKTRLMKTNLSLVLVMVDGKGKDDGASTSGCGELKTPSPDSTVTEGGKYCLLVRDDSM